MLHVKGTKNHSGLLLSIGLLIALINLANCAAMAAQNDADIGLHSDGGPWKFYPARQRNIELPRVLLIGDSIMNGYRGAAGKALQEEASVDVWLTPLHLKSPDLHHDLRRVLAQGPYDVIHFNLGLHGWTPGRIPDGEYEPSLRALVDILREHASAKKLIWASTTQITIKDKPTELDPVHNRTITKRNKIAARVMKEYGIKVNDLYGKMSDKLTLRSGDPYHWGAKAKAIQGGLVAKEILSILKPPPAKKTSDKVKNNIQNKSNIPNLKTAITHTK